MNSVFAQERFCPKCGTSFLGSPPFCGACGSPLNAPVNAPAVKTETAPPPGVYTPPSPPASIPDTGSVASSDQFIGAYRLLKVLGRGGMGVVYLAVRDDGTFRKQVALKLLLREMVNQEFVLRFKQERQVLAALDHPNIARILDGGDGPDGLPYYVMEFVEGQSIDEYCDKQSLSLTDRIKIFQQVCHAVHYLNQNSIIHRDLKPSNVLVSHDGVVKLLDFGIAKVVGAAAMQAQDLTGVDVRPMTPAYASPEQIEGRQLQASSDVYSLGVILYRLLTGRMPYADFDDKISKLSTQRDPTRPSANIREDLRAATDSPSKLKRALAGDLDSIVLKALRYNPQERYQTAADLSADLQHFLDGDVVTASHTTAFGRSFRIVKRQRFGAVAVLCGLLLAGLAVWQWQRFHSQPAEAAFAQHPAEAAGALAQIEKAPEIGNTNKPLEDPPKAPVQSQSTQAAPDPQAVPSTKTAVPPLRPSPSKAPAGRPLGSQTAQASTNPQVTPVAAPVAPVVDPKPEPQSHPAISEEERKDFEDRLDAVGAKIASTEEYMVPFRQRNAVSADTLSAMSLMHSRLDRAKRDFAANNFASAKEDLATAEALVAKVLKSVGR